MCWAILPIYVTVTTPLAGLFSSTLWYLDSKDYELPYMAEMRYGAVLVTGIPALFLALCEVGAL